MSLAVFSALVFLSGCEPIPDLGPMAQPAAADAEPQIIPVSQVLAAARGVTIAPRDTESLDARAEALRRRAEQLRARQPNQ